MRKISSIDESQPQTREELEEIFEKTLRPLQSRNARNIFLLLRDSKKEHLTTYDMQHLLEEQGNKLSKVELNNWLSAMQEVGFVQKEPERGKPTTRPYNKRYTFDLWKLTEKGREISKRLEIFRGNSPIQTREKVVEKTIEKIVEISKLPDLVDATLGDQEKVNALSMHIGLLKALKEKNSMDIMSLSEESGFTPKKIVEFIEDQEKIDSNTLYLLNEISWDLRGKILQTIGLNPKKNYVVSLSSEGKKMSDSLSF